MELRDEKAGDATVVDVVGRIDSATAQALADRLEQLVAAGNARIVIDLSAVDYISSAGLRAFMIGGRRAAQAKGGLSLCRPTPPVRRVLDLASIGELFPILATRPGAS